MTLRRVLVAFASLGLCACGGSGPGSGGTETVTGAERFGWDQLAADAGELASFHYAIYVDGARSEATDVSCAVVSTNGRFACTSALPALSPGSHSLQVAAYVIDGGAVLESTRSTAVRVVKR